MLKNTINVLTGSVVVVVVVVSRNNNKSHIEEIQGTEKSYWEQED